MKTPMTLVFCAAALLSACGGGDDSPEPTPTPAPTAAVPSSASASVLGLLNYLVALVASPADGLEPVDVSTVTPPTDDAIEPQPVD